MYYLRPQVTAYVILFIERDGSTYLTSMLMEHPEIQAEYEKFAVLRQQGAHGKEQLAWLDDFLTPPWLGKKAALGFKTKLVDVLDMNGFTHLLERKHCHIIQMRRRNMVKAVVSRINARRLYEASGNWNLYKESDRLPPLDVDLDQFDQFLEERRQADQALDDYVTGLNLPKIKVEYEDLLVNRDRVMNELFAFIRVQPQQLKGKTLKNTQDDLREVVLNFDDLRTRYAGTVYESMFDEVLVPAQ
jgi:LPS sulfotransferase NodH